MIMKNPNTKPFQMTNRCPENRQGTKSQRGYEMSLYCNIPGGRVVVGATRRQAKKAQRIYDRPEFHQNQIEDLPGRVMRALLRDILRWVGDDAEDSIYGGP